MSTAVLAAPSAGFQALDLTPKLLAVLDQVGYHQPTPIQAALIPEALKGRDVIGQAQTGTGKTAAFLLPFLNRFQNHHTGPQAIILAPTRELVVQVCEEARRLVPDSSCKVVPIYGGQRIQTQLSAMRDGFHIAVGTPGRVLDHLSRGSLDLSGITYAVLDEADRMLDIGFRPDIERILRRCPLSRQTLLLSATLPPPVLKLTNRYMMEPLHINLSPEKLTVSNIRQCYMTVDQHTKFELLVRVLHREKPKQCIIFCETKRGADQLFLRLQKYTKRARAMHGDLDQPQRERIMRAFRDEKVSFLVATDVVGRGIDVTGISHIINYDLPEDPENYVHRIGRTGRMGKNGVSISFVTIEEGEQLTKIENTINQQIDEDRLEGFQAFTPRPAPAPEEKKEYQPVFGRKVKRYRRGL